MTKEDFMAAAWSDFLRYAIGDKDILNAFARATGRELFGARSAIDAFIDRTTGKENDDIMAFMVWATRTQWGWDEAPESFRIDAEKWEREQPAQQPKSST